MYKHYNILYTFIYYTQTVTVCVVHVHIIIIWNKKTVGIQI